MTTFDALEALKVQSLGEGEGMMKDTNLAICITLLEASISVRSPTKLHLIVES